jgi:hypothetical protein
MKISKKNSKLTLQPNGDFQKPTHEQNLGVKDELAVTRKITDDGLWEFDWYKDPGALYYELGSPMKKIKPAAGSHFQLEELQQYAEGPFDVIPLHREGLPDKLMIVNKDWKLNGMRINLLATCVWIEYYGQTRSIKGPVVLCDLGLIPS